MKIVSINDIAEKVDYGLTEKAKHEKVGPKFLRITDIQNDNVNWMTVPYCECDEKEVEKNKLEVGDIVFARTGATTGKSFLIKKLSHKAVYASYLIRLKLLSDRVLPEFVSYFFKSDKYWNQIYADSDGATLPSFNATKLKALKIPLPSLSEQRAIVAKLDLAQRLIDIDRQMLAKYDELIQSVFLEMFGDVVMNPKGWGIAKLGDLCGVGSSKRVYVKELVGEGIPFYRGQEIGKLSEGEVLEPELFVTEDHYQELIDHSGKPEIGDLLMPSICPDGRIYIVESGKKFYFKDGRVLWVKAGESNIDSFYLRYHLKTLFQANYSEIASGTTFEELKIFALKKLQILNPPIDIQKAFQSEIEKINQDIDKTKLSLKKSEELFSSLVQGAFG